VSKSLALHLLLPLDFDSDRFRSTVSSIDWRERSSGIDRCSSDTDVVDIEKLEMWAEVRSTEVDFAITRRLGLGGGSCDLSVNLRGIIFRNRDCGVWWSRLPYSRGVSTGVDVRLELPLDECIEDGLDTILGGGLVGGSSSRVNQSGEGASTSGGSWP
jgi:hypothetical protein